MQGKIRTAGRRRLEVIGLGDGVEPRKAVALAVKHPKHNFTAVEWHPLPNPDYLPHTPTRAQYGAHLKRLGLKEKPANITFKHGWDAVEYLKKLKTDGVDHLYAHFLIQHMPHSQRKALYAQAIRVLRPGSRFTLVEGAVHNPATIGELKKEGFAVSVGRITPQELMKLKTSNAEHNVKRRIAYTDGIGGSNPL